MHACINLFVSFLPYFQGGEIGKAILDEAGDSLKKEYSRLPKIEPGSVVLTGAGKLKTLNLLHMVIKDRVLKTDKSKMQDAVTKCLNYADTYGYTSVSLPAVGTEYHKKDAKQSAQIMYNCIKEYRKKNEKSLKLIRIVIMQEKIFQDFKKAFGRKDPTSSTNYTGNTKDHACQTFFSPKLQSNPSYIDFVLHAMIAKLRAWFTF